MIVAPQKFDVLKTNIYPRSSKGKYANFKRGICKGQLDRWFHAFHRLVLPIWVQYFPWMGSTG